MFRVLSSSRRIETLGIVASGRVAKTHDLFGVFFAIVTKSEHERNGLKSHKHFSFEMRNAKSMVHAFPELCRP